MITSILAFIFNESKVDKAFCCLIIELRACFVA